MSVSALLVSSQNAFLLIWKAEQCRERERLERMVSGCGIPCRPCRNQDPWTPSELKVGPGAQVLEVPGNAFADTLSSTQLQDVGVDTGHQTYFYVQMYPTSRHL